jgi:IS5 family transposase
MRTENDRIGFAEYALQQRRKSRSDNFLQEAEKLLNWIPINNILFRNYSKNISGPGNIAYSPLKMFKILLLQTWYDLSDPAMEETLLDRLSFQRFAGFTTDDEIPDETTICRFRNELLKNGGYDKLFREINKQLEEKELIVKKGVIIDATVVESSRRPKKTVEVLPEDRKEEETRSEVNEVNIEYSGDRDARWLVKGSDIIYGYKAHVMVDSYDGFILGGIVTPANESDINHMEDVIKEGKIRPGTNVLADKGYACNGNDEILKKRRLNNLIMFKGARGHPLTEEKKECNRLAGQIRFRIEQTFGTLKRMYRFSRMRYLGLKKCLMEFQLKAMAFNLKKAVNLITI